MNEHEFSFDDDAHSGDEPEYEWLDEWLCEYVDGTMDPALEQVFEEYVEANPELKSHVENLRETRKLLCECSALKRASKKAQARVCSKVECDMLRSQASLSQAFSDRSGVVVGVVSSMVVALVVGFFAGAVFFSPEGANVSLSPFSSTSPAVTTTAPDRPAQRTSPVQTSVSLTSGAASSASFSTLPLRPDRTARTYSLQPFGTSPPSEQSTYPSAPDSADHAPTPAPQSVSPTAISP